ncbi:hypothetical protein [Paenibacillus xylaniclasticus]|uniref:hypothetical protein n=1 Tax=Paenibacillus xylaniclasticus TaxID=588083 RepID=UPI000FD8D101|nr:MULTISPECIES: hypothetical protein [Paenibacillus]GFN31010.1 hypothetical protein PCURB6_12700 [Paenibacillus curdlanolyticus]
MNSDKDKTRSVKLDLIASIARSQHALARILESVADVTSHHDPLAMRLRHNIEHLSRLQQTLVESVTGIRLGEPRRGRPAKPWPNRARLAKSVRSRRKER